MNNDYADLRSHFAQPVKHISIDCEFVRNEDGSFSVLEISLVDVERMIEIFHTFVAQPSNFILQQHQIERGFSEEKIKYAPKLENILETLAAILNGHVLIGWNLKSDLKHFPKLKQLVLASRCCMERYSRSYGPWNADFGDREFVRLSTAAKAVGFKLELGQCFHRASVDSLACAAIWNFCEQKCLPKKSIPGDLVSRKDVELLKAKWQKQFLNGTKL